MMASTLTEDHLTCTICYSPFCEPKTLQCLHSFCHNCIQQYINHAAKVRGFPCPVCREITMPPDSMQPKCQWASQLKTDFKLKGILEAVNQIEKDFTSTGNVCLTGSDESGDDLDDRTSQLKKLISVSDQLKASVTVLREQIDKREGTLHKMEEDKGIAEAGIKCTANAIIEEILTKEGNLLETLWMTYDDHKVEIEQQIQDRQEILVEVQDSLGLVDRLLSPGSEYATGEYLPQLLNQQEDAAEFLAQCSHSDVPSSVDFTFIPNPSFKETVIDTKLGVLRLIGPSGRLLSPIPSNNVTISSGLSFRSVSPFPDTDSPVPSEEPSQAGFSPGLLRIPEVSDNRSLYSSNNRIDAFGRESPTVSLSVDRVMLQKVLSTRLHEDENVPYPCGMVVLDDSNDRTVIVVVDSDNECVKSFYDENGQEKNHRLKLDNASLCIAKLSSDKVAVGVLSFKICIISVSPELNIISTIDTESVYDSLAVLKKQEKLFSFINISHTTVFTAKDSKIECFTFKDGKLKNPVKLNPSFTLSRITSLCATPSGDIIVCDANLGSVYCMKLSGDARWHYQQTDDLDNGSRTSAPTSVACDKQGNVYLVSKENHTIVKVAPMGDENQVVATRQTVQSPVAIAIGSNGQLFVLQQNGDLKFMTIS
ncbi:uncharacterized protein LOC121381129 isoform X2 [Gigantopelta aegis]|uniref:uncharacterized protein LOC121381129 isoform X2 n=1 Tax=Gigantopelta aegis TaxID=1735272 RepID=UPI001B88BB68|nr:uncharacterized protein LOC121381129 isoform X2 [Gigantopelta aegis]